MINKLFPFLFIILSQIGATEPVISHFFRVADNLGQPKRSQLPGNALKGAEEIFFYDKGEFPQLK